MPLVLKNKQMNKEKTKTWGKRDQTEVNICSDRLTEEIPKPPHCSFLKLLWLLSGKFTSDGILS